MKHVTIALATMAIAMLLTPSAEAGTGVYGYNHPPPNQRATNPGHRPKQAPGSNRHNKLKAQQARNECRTFAFRYWRFHPDYRHCRYR